MILGEKSTLQKVSFHKDHMKVLHGEDVSALAKQNYEKRKDPNRGFSKDRSWQEIASFSPLGWMEAIKKYPEIEHEDAQIRTRAIRKAINDPVFHILYCSAGGNI